VSSIDLRRAGDRGALLELTGNEEALRVARGLRSECSQLEDVVPGHRTVLVTWKGVLAEERLLAAAEAALAGGAGPVEPREVELSVRYDGPDLDEVARLAALSPEEVVARHARPTYTVGFLGFAPGFAYLLGGDEALRAPRLDVPRERVSRRRLALAGPYSGVYPRESPGGWRLIGSTDAILFDPERTPPALLAAGDRVRFTVTG
jgi:5-oxoprolinase (ATP-hydrolysing) subunit B